MYDWHCDVLYRLWNEPFQQFDSKSSTLQASFTHLKNAKCCFEVFAHYIPPRFKGNNGLICYQQQRYLFEMTVEPHLAQLSTPQQNFSYKLSVEGL
ncbi:MAG: hypothetical protein ACRCWQ_07705, partial [Bacilli bacterium]